MWISCTQLVELPHASLAVHVRRMLAWKRSAGQPLVGAGASEYVIVGTGASEYVIVGTDDDVPAVSGPDDHVLGRARCLRSGQPLVGAGASEYVIVGTGDSGHVVVARAWPVSSGSMEPGQKNFAVGGHSRMRLEVPVPV